MVRGRRWTQSGRRVGSRDRLLSTYGRADVDPRSDLDSHRRTYVDTSSNMDSCTDPHAYSSTYIYCRANCNRYGNASSHVYPYRDTISCANSYTYCYSNPNAYTHSDGDADSYSNASTHIHTYAASDTGADDNTCYRDVWVLGAYRWWVPSLSV